MAGSGADSKGKGGKGGAGGKGKGSKGGGSGKDGRAGDDSGATEAGTGGRLKRSLYEQEWYFQRYIRHLPAGGHIVLFDRSWYNRAGVERVMGFCSKEEYGRFMHQCPLFERMLVEDGILLRKYWFSVSDGEQQRRFKSRLDDPMRRWKLSTMDLESITRWEDYSRSKDEMFVHTDIPEAPWYVVESDDKRSARLNMIAHLLSTVPYQDVQRTPLKLPERPPSKGYIRMPKGMQTYVPDYAANLATGARGQ